MTWHDRVEIFVGYLFSLAVSVAQIAALIYIFSLLESRVEFLIVSCSGMIYSSIAVSQRSRSDATYAMLITTMVGSAKIRSLLGDPEMSDPSRFDQSIALDTKRRVRHRYLSLLCMATIELICLYELLLKLGSPYVKWR